MYPYINLTIGAMRVEVGSYRLALLVAAVLGGGLALLLAHRRGLGLRASAMVLAAGAAGVPIGARLLHALANPSVYTRDPAALISLAPSGFALYGGLLGGVTAGVLMSRALGYDIWNISDAAAAGVAVGVVVVRFGCYGRGCCFGLPTTAPWGVSFPVGSPPQLTEYVAGKVAMFSGSLALHPTQLYESVGAALGLGVILAVGSPIGRRAFRLPTGVPALLAAMWFTIMRWLSWSVRYHPPSLAAPAWVYPGLMYVAVLLACASALLWRFRDQWITTQPAVDSRAGSDARRHPSAVKRAALLTRLRPGR